MILRRNRLEMAVALACGAASIGMPAWAGTYMVTTLEDSGPGSLRQAVLDANNNLDDFSQTIQFQSGLTGAITLTSGEIEVTGNLTIRGPGAKLLAISGNDQSRIFYNKGTGLTLEGMTLKKGKAQYGGAIYSVTILTLNEMVIFGNKASEPEKETCGGGIYNSGMANIYRSTLQGNLSEAGDGGAICHAQGNLNIVNSTIAQNRADQCGGICVFDGTAAIAQSTIVLNSALNGNGGGIGLLNENTAKVVLANTIISSNVSSEKGDNIYDSGYQEEVLPQVAFKGVNLVGQYNQSGFDNIYQDVGIRASDLVLQGGIETVLTTNIEDHGGPIMTFALVEGSPAINAGDNAAIPPGVTTDQRGEGFARIVGEKVDIGAFEYGNEIVRKMTLAVTKNGGNGTVTSKPAGITCGDVCSASFEKDMAVTLTAKPDTGNSFAGWSGACTNTTGTCKVTIDAAKTVTALFSDTPPPKTYKLTTTKTGLGTITGAGEYAAGAAVKLTAKPSTGYTFCGWKPLPCAASFTMPAKALTCIAQFAKICGGTTYTLAVKAKGPGTVKGAGKYAAGATVKLTATPKEGATFVGWNPSPCAASFRMPAKALTCTATFEQEDDAVEHFPSTDGSFPKGWTTPSDSTAPWEVSGIDPAYEGTYTLTSGLIYDGQKSHVEVSGTFEAGNVEFAARVSSEKVDETNGDALRFTIDGVLKDQWSGEMDWKAVSYPLTAGPHTLRWSYEKDSAKTAGKDQAWIDDVLLPKGLCGAGCEVWPPKGEWPVGWTTDNVETPWIIDDSTLTKNSTHEGRYTLRSAVINNSQRSELRVTEMFPAGTVKFARRVSSEKGYDFLRFSIDGVQKGEWSGEENWAEFSYPLTAGEHTLTWAYVKGRTGAAGKDMAWIDNVVLPGR